VIVDSEHVWDEARMRLAEERGGRWHAGAQGAMMGMSSTEWSRYMHDVIEVPEPPEEISAEVVRRLSTVYREELPLIPGAVEAVRRLATRFRLGLASSSNRELIDLVLDLAEIADCFEATVASEEVAHGKPAPNVYLEVARLLEVVPEACAAVEDSHNGILSARRAGMRVIAIPNPRFPPEEGVLAEASVVLRSPAELTLALVGSLEPRGRPSGGR
jgi:HAD superfamily hydrolase (TIGR01509 family)